jgi:hypothetical protein
MRYKDSITFDTAEVDDANPEGINQYTVGAAKGMGKSKQTLKAEKASTIANELSERAMKSGKPEDHRAAKVAAARAAEANHAAQAAHAMISLQGGPKATAHMEVAQEHGNRRWEHVAQYDKHDKA